MAIYTVQAPDGSTIRVEGPEGASDEEVIAQAQRLWQAEQQPARQPFDRDAELARLRQQNVEEMSTGERFLVGAGKAFSDIGTGAGQMLERAKAAMFPALQPAAAARLAASQAAETERRQIDAPLMATTSGTLGNIAGNIAAAIPAAMAAPATLPSLAAQGAAFGALQPTATGESAAQNAAIGGLLGAAVPWGLGKVGQGVRRVFSPAGVAVDMPAQNAARETAADLLQQYGITPSIAQRTGSRPLQTLESVLAEMPSTSASILQERAAQQTGLNRAITGLLGEASDTVDDAVMAKAFDRMGAGYKAVAQNTTLNLGDDFVTKMAAVDEGYARYLPSTVRDAYRARLDDLVELAGKPLSGERYQAIRSELGKAAAGTNDAGYKSALKGMQSALDDEFARAASPTDLAAKLKLDEQYRAAKILNDASLLTGDKQGISAAKAVNKLEREVRKGKVMPEMVGLLRAAGEIIPDRIPNSGTAQRTMMQQLITGQATPGLLGLGTGLLTGDPTAGLYAAGAGYLGPRAMLAMLRNPTGARWIGGQYALPQLTGRAAEVLPRVPALATPGLLGIQ